MPQITIDLTDKQLAGVAAARNAWNASNVVEEEESPAPLITDSDYIAMVMAKAADSYVAAHNVGIVTSSAFLLRFSGAEFDAIKTAAESSPELQAYIARLQEVDKVHLDSEETVAGIQALVAAGLLTQLRADQVLEF